MNEGGTEGDVTPPYLARPAWQRYGLAILTSLSVVPTRMLLAPLLGHEVPMVPFVIAVIVSSLFGGFGPGLLATIISTVAGALLFVTPTPHVMAPSVTLLALFFIVGVVVSITIEAMHRAQNRSEVRKRELEREVMERRRIAERLRYQLELTDTITQHAPVAIYLVDVEDRITFANPESERLFGWKESEITGKLMHDVIHHHYPDGRPYPAQECPQVSAIREGRHVTDVEETFFRKDGTPVEVICSITPIAGSEQIGQGSVIVVQDITLRKQAEEALREADRRKGEFLAVLAHELRTPLGAIHSAVEASAEDPTPEEARWAREVISRQTQQLSLLIDDLLDLTRIERGKIRLKPEPLDAASVAEAAADAVRPLVSERQHELTVSISHRPLPVRADPVRLQQIITNLLNNAAKYTPEGGRIWLSAGSENGDIEIRVRDTGVGISADMLPRLWDPYMQVEGSLAQARGGMGIGLPLVQELAHLHGGKVSAYSAGPGKGSEFIVQLPLTQEQPPPVQARPSGGPQGQGVGRGGLLVLLVEDDVDAAQGLARLLKRSGHEVQIAHNGTNALKAAEESPPDVVICDIGLPDMDGYEVAKRLRERRAPARPLLIALSGYGHHHDRIRACEAGFDEQFLKPVDLSALRALLAGKKSRVGGAESI